MMAKDSEETIYAPGGAEELEATRFEGQDSSPGVDTEPGVTTDRIRKRVDPAIEATVFAGGDASPPARPSERPSTAPTTGAPVDRTRFAEEGLRVGVSFAHAFAKRTIGVRGHLGVRLSDPGLSTDGGHKARQSIVLVADTRARGTTVIGWLDTSRRAAALKPWTFVSAQHTQRFRAPPDFERSEYETLVGEIERFFGANDIAIEAHDQGATANVVDRATRVEWAIAPRHVAFVVALILAVGVVIGVFAAKSCGGDEVEEPRPHLKNPLERFKKP